MLCPWIAELGQFHTHLHIIIYGITVLIAGIVALFLPETAGRKLPDTVKESESLKLLIPMREVFQEKETNDDENKK